MEKLPRIAWLYTILTGARYLQHNGMTNFEMEMCMGKEVVLLRIL